MYFARAQHIQISPTAPPTEAPIMVPIFDGDSFTLSTEVVNFCVCPFGVVDVKFNVVESGPIVPLILVPFVVFNEALKKRVELSKIPEIVVPSIVVDSICIPLSFEIAVINPEGWDIVVSVVPSG
jgi:hypothetical protein